MKPTKILAETNQIKEIYIVGIWTNAQITSAKLEGYRKNSM
jgi:hypothetical protein